MSDHPRTLEEAVERLLSTMDKRRKDFVASTDLDDFIALHHNWPDEVVAKFGLWDNAQLVASCGEQSPHHAAWAIVYEVWRRLRHGG